MLNLSQTINVTFHRKKGKRVLPPFGKSQHFSGLLCSSFPSSSFTSIPAERVPPTMVTHSQPETKVSTTPTELIVPSTIDPGARTDPISEHARAMAKETTPTEIIIPVDIGQDHANCSIEQLQHQHQHQLDQLQPKNKTTIPAQVKIPPSKAPDHEIGVADNTSQHKEPLTSVSSPNESPPLDSKALANVTIADKFKKYPGFIHPYTVSFFRMAREHVTFTSESIIDSG